MKITDVLNENDLRLLESHKDAFGNPDNDYIDELLLNHSLSLDIKDYAILRLVETLRKVEGEFL